MNLEEITLVIKIVIKIEKNNINLNCNHAGK
jgi:hypothetical protein